MGRPKALLDYHGETFIARLVRIFATVCDPVIVALGHGAETLSPHVPEPARVVMNPDPGRGQLSSLQIALTALPPSISGFLFTLVDCPAVNPATVQAVAAQNGDLVIPRYQGRRGHPVRVSCTLIAEFLSLPPTAETRQVINAHADAIRYLDLDDPGILVDADDPAAYARLTGKALEPVP